MMAAQSRIWRIAKRAAIAIVLVSFVAQVPSVRVWLTRPLVVTDDSASGDVANVLAGGTALRERLAAAADLYHMHRVPRILLMRDTSRSAYSFKARASWTATDWAIDTLKWLGVPEDRIGVFNPQPLSWLGTGNEARNLAVQLPNGVTRLVIVTSPSHTRRALLTMKRALPARIAVTSYTGQSIEESIEFNSPLWLEYLKLAFYACVA